MDSEIEKQLFEIIKQIKAWDPEEYSAEMLLRLCDEFDRIKPEGMSMDDLIETTQLGCAAEFKERVMRKSHYPILACDFTGDCIIRVDEWYIVNIDEIDGEY